MSDKNNIEDFFNNSLDGFHDEPSDRVWEGVESRLNVAVPFWKTLWFGGILAVMLLSIGGFWMYRNNIQQQFQDLLVAQDQLERRNMELEVALRNCSTPDEQLSILEREQEQFSNTLNTNEESLSHEMAELRAEIQEVKRNKSKNQIKSENGELKNSSIIGKAEITVQENDREVEPNLIPIRENPSAVKDQFSNESLITLDDSFGKEDNLQDELIDERKNYLKIGGLYLKRNIAIVFDRNPLRDSIFIFKVRAAKMLSIQNLIKGEEVFKPSLRFGVNATGFTTFSDLDNTINLGYKGGLVINFQAFNNLFLTSGLNFNLQKHKLSGIENQNLINSFPNISQIGQDVKSVHTQNYYFDVPVGIKWNIPLQNSRSDYYIHTGVAWQFYLPQKFTYFTEDNTSIDFRGGKYFAYFGTVFLNPGIEVEINPRLRYNLSIWAERGLVDYGIEKRRISNLGIRGTLLFGR